MRDARDASDDATVIEVGQGQGRLRISGSSSDLHCGEPILVEVAGVGMVPARVEFDGKLGWVAYVRDGYEQSGEGHGQASVVVFLRPGLKARRP